MSKRLMSHRHYTSSRFLTILARADGDAERIKHGQIEAFEKCGLRGLLATQLVFFKQKKLEKLTQNSGNPTNI